MEIEKVQSPDPVAHTRKIAMYLQTLKDHCRADISEIKDPKAQALLETAAEVLAGLEKAFKDFCEKKEVAFKKNLRG